MPIADKTSFTIVLGFDFGTKRIGIAVGNRLTGTAQPLKILDAREGQPDWDIVAGLISEWGAGALVVGMPYTADGTETEHLLKVKKFKNRLHGRFGLPVFEVDEFQSSYESEGFIKGSRESKKKNLDAISAAIILERWLLQDEMAQI